MKRAHKISIWCTLVAVSSCAEVAERGTAVSSRDSLGILVVEATGAPWTPEDGWRVADTPSLSIGLQDGDPEYLFNRVRGTLRLADGRIVVADGGSSEIRFFDPLGSHLTSSGGPGEGPGEFRFIGSMWRHADDSLMVTDLAGVTVMDSAGQFHRRFPLELAEGRYRGNAVGQTEAGTLLVVSGSRGFSPADAGTVIRDSLRFFRYDADGTLVATITVLPSAERWGLLVGGISTFPYVPFSARPIWTVSRNRFYIGSGREAEVSVWTLDGSLDQILRWPKPARPVTDALREQFRAYSIESTRDANDRRRQERFLAEVPIAEDAPTYQSLIVDSEENLWLEVYRTPWESERNWDVIASDGTWLGSVSMPDGFTPYQIGADYILGVSRDDLGVERVEYYLLAKSPAGA